MAEHLLRKRLAQRHQEDGPVNGVEADDVLADDVHVRRPELFVQVPAFAVRLIAQRGDVVGQRVQPHVDHVLVVKAHRDAPLEGRAGDAQVLQAGQQEIVHHLVLAGDGLDEFRVLVDVRDQPVRIFAHAEEIRLFGRAHERPAAVRALAVRDLRFREEGLVGHAVPAFVGAFIDVALVVQLLEDLLHLGFMVIIRGADEVIIGNVQGIPNAADVAGDPVHERLGLHPGGFCLLLDLLAVLVGAGLEEDVVALRAAEAGDRVRQDDLVAVADVRLAGSVRDGGGNIVRFVRISLHMVSFFPCRTASCAYTKKPCRAFGSSIS